MSNLAAWLANQRIARILAIAGLALFPLGLLGLLSAALVVMVAILRGWRIAIEDCLMALAALLLIAGLAGASLEAFAVSTGVSWGSAALLGSIAGRYGSLTLPIQMLVVLAACAVLLFAALVEDPVAFWLPMLRDLAEQLGEAGLPVTDSGGLDVLAPVMTGLAASSGVLSSVLALLLGSWWSAAAGGPAFAGMFLGIRMGVVLGLLAAAAGIAAAFNFGWLPGSLLLIFGSGFAVQGASVLHWLARARSWPWPVLAVVYGPLLFGPAMIALVWLLFATLGFVDNWYGLRRKGADVIK